MAEKEERIYITKIQPECKFRELHETTAGGHTWVDFMCGKSKIRNLECDDKSFEQCEWKELTGISRQEAIDRICKGIMPKRRVWPCKECRYGKDNASCQTCLEVELYKQYAEAALNALLEGDK